MFANSSVSSLLCRAWTCFWAHCSEMPHQSTLLYDKGRVERAPFQWKANRCFCLCKSKPQYLFMFLEDAFSFSRGWTLSLFENCIVLRQVTRSRRPHWCKQRRKEGEEERSWGFLKPLIPEGAIPALVVIRTLISRMIRNLLINKYTNEN
jgi:hypothetical protein